MASQYNNSDSEERRLFEVSPDEAGLRLDKFLCQSIDSLSRERARAWIEEGRVSIDATARTDENSQDPGQSGAGPHLAKAGGAIERRNEAAGGQSIDRLDERGGEKAGSGQASAGAGEGRGDDAGPARSRDRPEAGRGDDAGSGERAPASAEATAQRRGALPSRPPGRVAGSYRLRAGQGVEVIIPPPERDYSEHAEDIAIDIVWEDDDLIVINKPVGLVVQPGAGNPRRTLHNALLHWSPKQRQIERAGIVHRLDKDTSGLMIVACSWRALRKLQRAFKAHAVRRQYLAIVHGSPISGGVIDAPLGRHRAKRTQFDVVANGRPAVTHFRILKRFECHTAISARLETGRTHQIRVHMRHIGYPVVGDPVYGSRRPLPASLPPPLHRLLSSTRRQMLHSWQIAFEHPVTGEQIALSSPLPADIRARLRALARHSPA